MVYRIGINDIEPDHWVAWVFDCHGCFSKAGARDEAIAGVPRAIEEYFRWLKDHSHRFTPPEQPYETTLAEDVQSFALGDGYFANAFFEDDRRPLTADDIEEVRQLLTYTRKDLNAVIERVSPEQMDKPIEGEVQRSIRGVLNHIANAEWWYHDRVDLAFDWQTMPDDVLARLEKVRGHTVRLLPGLEGKTEVFERRSEKWSARKLVRRTLWHEIAHTRQIRRYLRSLS